jgi:hypothetical protein
VMHMNVAPGRSMVVKSPFTKEEAPVYPIQRTWRKSQASFSLHNCLQPGREVPAAQFFTHADFQQQ